jgi:hypothetical protein
MFESDKYKDLSEEEFLNILKANCTNFSLDNDQLYRGDKEGGEFILHNPIRRKPTQNSWGEYSYQDFFIQRENKDKYPVTRQESLIGVAGSNNVEEMKQICRKISESQKVYRVIPFDNCPIVFAPIFDIILFDGFGVDITDDDFIMVKYTKDFRVPIKELKDIQDKLLTDEIISYTPKLTGNYSIPNKGFEFFMSSSALLIDDDLVKNYF